MKSIQTLLLLATSFALAFSQQQTCNTYCAYSAPLNKSIGPSGSVDLTTYFFDGGVFPPSAYDAQAGQCGLQVAFNGNSLTITGTVYAPNDPSTGFFINIQSTRNFSGTPFEELTPSVYVSNGGYVDTTNWVYYSLNSGKLVGFGKYPVTLDLTETMHPLQVGAGANGKNINYGLSAWFDITFNGTTHMTDINVDLTCAPVPTSAPTAAPTVAPTAAPTAAPTVAPTVAPTAAPTVAPTVAPTAAPTDAPTSAPTEVPTDAPTSAPTDAPTEAPSTGVSTTGSTSGSSSDYTCPPNPFIARQAIADQYGGYSYFAFIFNVSSTNVQYRFDFTNDSGSFQENADGTATLTGSLSPLSYNPQDGVFAFDFSVQINFVAGTAPSTYHEELNPSAYVPYGPVDPSTWKYYAPSSSTFTVSGGQYTIVVSQFMDMEFQVGYGANGKNINFGASSWFDFTLTDSNGNQVASGVLDVDVDLVCEQNGSSSSTTAASSATGGQVSSPSASPSSTSDASAVSFSFLLAMILAIVFAL